MGKAVKGYRGATRGRRAGEPLRTVIAARLIAFRAVRPLWLNASAEGFGVLPIGFIVGLGAVAPNPLETLHLRIAFGLAETAAYRSFASDAPNPARDSPGDSSASGVPPCPLL